MNERFEYVDKTISGLKTHDDKIHFLNELLVLAKYHGQRDLANYLRDKRREIELQR